MKQETILLDLLRVVSHHQARLATPIRTIQKVYSDTDLENVPFSDGIFSRSRAPANRPLLLIEPPAYKINGDDKVKPSNRTGNVHANEEKDGKVEANNSTAESKVGRASAPDVKKNEKAASPLGSGPVSKKSTVTSSDQKDQNMGPSTSSQAKPEQQQVMDNKKENGLKEASRSGQLEESGSAVTSSELGGGKAENDLPRQKPETKHQRATLEENIVLGVALEGSKRTLPIEEETAPTDGAAEPKELTTQRNGSGPIPGGKDKKDGQISSTS